MAISRSTNRTTGSYGKGAGSLQSRKRKNGQSSTLPPEELQAAVAPPVANPAAMAGRPAFVSSSSQPQQPGLADTPQIAQPESNIDHTSLLPSASLFTSVFAVLDSVSIGLSYRREFQAVTPSPIFNREVSISIPNSP